MTVLKKSLTEHQRDMLGLLKVDSYEFARQFARTVLYWGTISERQAMLLNRMIQQRYGSGKHCATQCHGEHESTNSEY